MFSPGAVIRLILPWFNHHKIIYNIRRGPPGHGKLTGSNMDKLYAMEDAQRILQIAIAQETESGELSQQQLLEIAEELNKEFSMSTLTRFLKTLAVPTNE